MAGRIKLRDVVDAIDLPSQGWHSYINRDTGEIVTVSDEERSLVQDDVDPDELRREIERATAVCIAAQVDAGIDIGNDGEQARESFFTYVQHRMTGFGGEGDQPRTFKDRLHYPSFNERFLAARRAQPLVANLIRPPKAIGEVHYADRAPLEQECASFASALRSARHQAMALEARGFGAQRERTTLLELRLRAVDRAVVVLALAAMVAALWVMFTGALRIPGLER